jgi:tRNA (guanine26-N2/guanine27-N2)-dimethyltransferase
MHEITEGSATISSPNGQVFYNPVQQFNRDISIVAISTYLDLWPQQNPTLLEALSATGLRSIRYHNEITPSLVKIIANDICPTAVQNIKRNFENNYISLADPTARVTVSQADACSLMYQRAGTQFQIIDLDPYGSASPFLDAAMQAIDDGGLLCVTCTDSAVLCGNHPEACYGKYGANSLKGSPFCHESALRILLAALDSCGNRYKKTIEPLMSLSVDFYVRVFVRVVAGAKSVRFAASNRSLVLLCQGCRSWRMQPLGKAVSIEGKSDKKFGVATFTAYSCCRICKGTAFQIGGPLWNGLIHSQKFLKGVLERVPKFKHLGTTPRIIGMCTVALEELDVPFYFPISMLANVLHSCTAPLLKIYSALLWAGFRVSGSHCEPGLIKTDAPLIVLWQIVKHWVLNNQSNYSVERLSKESPAWKIMSELEAFEGGNDLVKFDIHPEANPASRKIRLVRYQENPTKFWGPKARAKALKVVEE